jgi:hypothetical protein
MYRIEQMASDSFVVFDTDTDIEMGDFEDLDDALAEYPDANVDDVWDGTDDDYRAAERQQMGILD